MEHAPNWNAQVARHVGKRVAYFRKRVGDKGITAQALADRCAELGHPLDRTVIAKLEKGLRQSVTVADLLVLAEALAVSPTALVVPIDEEATTEILPGQEVPAFEALDWFTGERPQPWSSGRPSNEFALLNVYREHERSVAEWRSQSERAAQLMTEAGLVSAEPRIKLIMALASAAEGDLQQVRREMRQRGVRVPVLPPELAHIAGEEQGA